MCCSKGNSKCNGSEDRELRCLWGLKVIVRVKSEVNGQGTQQGWGTAVPEKGLQITRWLPASSLPLTEILGERGPSSGKATPEKAEGHQGTTRPAIQAACLREARMGHQMASCTQRHSGL